MRSDFGILEFDGFVWGVKSGTIQFQALLVKREVTMSGLYWEFEVSNLSATVSKSKDA